VGTSVVWHLLPLFPTSGLESDLKVTCKFGDVPKSSALLRIMEGGGGLQPLRTSETRTKLDAEEVGTPNASGLRELSSCTWS